MDKIRDKNKSPYPLFIDRFLHNVRTAVINKRAGGMGLITGRKAFQRPMEEGVTLLHAIQDVYLCREVTVD
jgi:class I fructose-bisphosphate aldolase